MPRARSILLGKSLEYARRDVAYASTVQTLNVAKDDRFQIVSARSHENAPIAPDHLGIRRAAD